MSTTFETSPPFVANGPNNLGGVVVVVSFIFLCVTILFAFVRAYNAVVRKKGFGFDDLAWSLAVMILIPQSVAVERAVHHGLGQHIDAIDASDLNIFYEWVYISQLLSVAVQCLSKFAVILLVIRLDSGPMTWKWCRILSAVTFIWTCFAMFTIAFQCGTHEPWIQTPNRCAADGKLYYAIIAFNIITDALLALFFLPAIWKLQMDLSTRRTISVLFASRLLVCGIAIGQLVILESYVSDEDKTWGITTPIILDQVLVNLAVITAGVPSVHRFLADLRTGHFGGTHIDDHELSAVGRSSSSGPHTPNHKSRTSTGGLRSVLASNVSSHFPSTKPGPAKSRAVPQKSIFKQPVTLAASSKLASGASSSGRPGSDGDDEKPLRLAPETNNEFSTLIYGGAKRDRVGEASSSSKQDRSTIGSGVGLRENDGSRRDSESRSSQQTQQPQHGVLQKREFSMQVEYVK